jgi:phage gp36-like protein
MVSQYAQLADLVLYGIPVTAIGNLTTAQQTDALIAASAKIDSYLRGRYSLPLLAWGIEITQAACKIAAFDLMNVRGYNPQSGADNNLINRYNETILWLRDIQRQAAHPDVTPTDIQTQLKQGPAVISVSAWATNSGCTNTNRGW